MTVRFSLNNFYESTNSWNQFMYDFFVFMTKTSPNGPGWISIGESNGSSGGMGTIGLITSASSFSSTYSWYVLRSPDSKYQLLMNKGASSAYYGGMYLTNYVFSGGSSSALPTFNSNNTLQFPYSVRLNNGNSAKYTFNFIADDSLPYGFYAFAYNLSSNICTDLFGMIPMDGYNILDGYPIAFISSSYNYQPIKSNFSSDASSRSTSTVSYGSLGFGITGSTVAWCQLANYMVNSTVLMPGNGPNINTNSILSLPTYFASQTLYKGISTNWVRTPANFILNQGDTIDNKKWIRMGDWLFRWDGYTSPRIA